MKKRLLRVVPILLALMLAFSGLAAKVPSASASSPQKEEMAPPCLEDTSVQNDYLQIAVADPPSADAAKFTLGNTGGDPANPDDDNRILLYGHPNPWSSFTTVRIDGADFVYGGSEGSFTQNPTGYPSYIKSVWVADNVQVTQVLALTLNPWTNRTDAMEIRYMVQNLDMDNSHDVGVRVLMDTMLGSNDGAPFQIPGTGAVTTEREYVGASVPKYWQAFDSLEDPTVVSQGTFNAGDATAPDRAIFASWPDFYGTLWDYTVTPGKSFGSAEYVDSSVGLYWNPKTLDGGDKIEYVTYYGLSDLSQSMLPPLTLSVTGPLTLSIIANKYSPNPFPVQAYVQNVSTQEITDIALNIDLPPGLSLDGSDSTQTIASIAPNDSSSVSWSVSAADQTSDAQLSYTVTASAAGLEPRTVTRGILIPQLSLAYDTTFRSEPDGYQFRNFRDPVLSWDFFRDTFGADEVEINGQRSPRADAWYQSHFIHSDNGGSCFGMASSSLVLFQNSHEAWDLGSDRTAQLDDSVQSWFPSFIQTPTQWVEYYQARQADNAIQSDRERVLSAKQVYGMIKGRMASGDWAQNPLVLSLRWWDDAAQKTKGHAVVPYRIEESADGRTAIVRIYDSNYSGEERTVEFDLENDEVRDADYNQGNPFTRVLVCNLSAIQMEPQMRDYDTVTPDAHLLYTDAGGNRLGYVDGQSVDEIPGAYSLLIDQEGEGSQAEAYYVGDLSLKQELIGTEDGLAAVSVMRPNGLVTIQVHVTPTSHDQIAVSGDGLSVSFLSHEGTPSVSIMLDQETDDLARVVTVDGFAMEPGGSMSLRFSDDLSSVVLTNDGAAKTCSLHFEQVGQDPSSRDTAPISVGQDSSQDFPFVDSDLPSAPVLSAPADGTTTDDNVVELDWDDVADLSVPVTYQVQVDSRSDFSSPEYDSGWITASNAATPAFPDGAYFWRARARDGAGNTGSWSAVWQFTVETAPPSGTIEVTTTPVFGSFTITGPASYSGTAPQTYHDAPVGEYTIVWGDVLNYTKPADESLTLTANDSITFEGVYVRNAQTGTIMVTSNVAAPFVVSGPALYTGTADWTNDQAHVGDYSIICLHVDGYVTPSSGLPQTLTAGGTITFDGFYEKIPGPVGVIEVTSNIGAPYVVTGPATYTGTGDWTYEDAPIGEYTIHWGDVADYITPPGKTLTLTEAGRITFAGTYVPATGWTHVFQDPGRGMALYINTSTRTFCFTAPDGFTTGVQRANWMTYWRGRINFVWRCGNLRVAAFACEGADYVQCWVTKGWRLKYMMIDRLGFEGESAVSAACPASPRRSTATPVDSGALLAAGLLGCLALAPRRLSGDIH